MPTIEHFIVLATTLHSGQFDKAGQPYIWHPLRVSDRVRGYNRNENHIIAALLHDTIEDCFEDVVGGAAYLRYQGVPDMVVQTVEVLTHAKGQPYQEYIDGIIAGGNPIAMVVKYEDVRDNYNRLDVVKDPATKKRLHDKYYAALGKLRNFV